jgi:Protein of unknown function (DUF1488)
MGHDSVVKVIARRHLAGRASPPRDLCERRISMPLVRDQETFEFERFDGVYFWMKDCVTPVLCRVSHEALRNRSARDGEDASVPDTFIRHRERIERIAAENYEKRRGAS